MVLRAKIDMAHANMHMRDPFVPNQFAHHHRTGDAWCIDPMYDSLWPVGQHRGHHAQLVLPEFENHRPLYDWYIESSAFSRPNSGIARLNLNYTIMSKRKLLRLVEDGVVDGWDDPGCPRSADCVDVLPESIREFGDRVGVAKRTTSSTWGCLNSRCGTT